VVKIVNAVVSVTLQHKLDLTAIVKAFPFVQYRREQFPGAVFRLSYRRKKVNNLTLIPYPDLSLSPNVIWALVPAIATSFENAVFTFRLIKKLRLTHSGFTK
jgi:hypothetical protein